MVSFKSRLKFLSRFTSRQFISFWAFNTIWKSCICLFLCFLPLVPLHAKLPDQGRLFQPPAVNFLNEAGVSLSPYQTPTRTRSRPGSGRGRPARCNLGVVVKAAQRHRGWETGIQCSVHGAVTRVWGSKGKSQHLPRSGFPRRSSRHKRGRAESRKIPTTPREAIVTGAPFPGGRPAPSGYASLGKWSGALVKGGIWGDS